MQLDMHVGTWFRNCSTETRTLLSISDVGPELGRLHLTIPLDHLTSLKQTGDEGLKVFFNWREIFLSSIQSHLFPTSDRCFPIVVV